MKLPRRTFLHLAAGAAALPAVSRIAWAQTYPARPVRLLFGFAAGGPGDTVVRLMGQWLSERLGQQFVVENRLGAAPAPRRSSRPGLHGKSANRRCVESPGLSSMAIV